MSLTNLKQYPLVIALFFPDKWESFSPGRLMFPQQVLDAQMVIAFEQDGTTKILKNRWGKHED